MVICLNEERSKRALPRLEWDDIDSSHFVTLVGVRKMTSEFGFLLRHYWTPMTDLYYRLSVRQCSVDRQKLFLTQTIKQSMKKCNADRCVWRQTILDSSDRQQEMIGLVASQTEEILCEYNRSTQTFHANPIFDFTTSLVDMDKAQVQAFLGLPILCPLLPVLLGFRWYIKSKYGYLNFQLESMSVVGEMPVVFIRRKGFFSLDCFFQNDNIFSHRFQVKREGFTAYALERSVVLEDRVYDTIRDSDGTLDGIEMWTTKCLTQSSL
jgi:hypothetical protein